MLIRQKKIMRRKLHAKAYAKRVGSNDRHKTTSVLISETASVYVQFLRSLRDMNRHLPFGHFLF